MFLLIPTCKCSLLLSSSKLTFATNGDHYRKPQLVITQRPSDQEALNPYRCIDSKAQGTSWKRRSCEGREVRRTRPPWGVAWSSLAGMEMRGKTEGKGTMGSAGERPSLGSTQPPVTPGSGQYDTLFWRLPAVLRQHTHIKTK